MKDEKVKNQYTKIILDVIHRDIKIPTVSEEITRFARKHVKSLKFHTNSKAIQILDYSQQAS